jgi:hypothetical protein
MFRSLPHLAGSSRSSLRGSDEYMDATVRVFDARRCARMHSQAIALVRGGRVGGPHCSIPEKGCARVYYYYYACMYVCMYNASLTCEDMMVKEELLCVHVCV